MHPIDARSANTFGGERAEPLLPRRPLIPAPAAHDLQTDRRLRRITFTKTPTVHQAEAGPRFRWCANPAALQRICNRLGPNAVQAFFWHWFHRLPSPFTTADLQAGYAYDLAFRQFEVSDTRVFSQPQAGRAFFEGVIRDHLDIGRPDQVVLIFDRRLTPRTPGRFRTKVVTRGVNPQLSCTYTSCRLKQYFKLGVALRTELVIGDTRDFGIGRRVCALNWTALRAVGDSANQRLCDAEAQTAQPAPDVVTLTHVTRPSTTTDGLHAPALAFGDTRGSWHS